MRRPTLLSDRFWALLRKEFGQIRRDRRLAVSLILPPVVQLLLFSVVLNAKVENLKLGIFDESRTPESRELTATLTESRAFRIAGYYGSASELADALGRGDVDAGVDIPKQFTRDLERGNPVTVQFLLNAMNANTAAIAQGYAEGVISAYNEALTRDGLHARFRQIAAPNLTRRGVAQLFPDYLYNPGLVGSWFIVPGIFGLLLILNGSIVAGATLVRERERGTIEQLLMSPAGTYEIVIAKMAPLCILLFLMALFAMAIAKLAFDIPFHGHLGMVMVAAIMCVLCGVSIGTMISTFAKSAQQSQLTSFFVNPPLASLSGAFAPVQAIPSGLRWVAAINPINHFGIITRSAMIRGAGWGTLWPNYLALLAFTVIVVSLSVWRFRKQFV